MTKLYQFLLIHLLSKLLLVVFRLQLVLSSIFINSFHWKTFFEYIFNNSTCFSDIEIILLLESIFRPGIKVIMYTNERIYQSEIVEFLSNVNKNCICTHYGPANQEFKSEYSSTSHRVKGLHMVKLKFKLSIRNKEKLIKKVICHILQQTNFLLEIFLSVFPLSLINLCQDGIDRYFFQRGRILLWVNYSEAQTPALVLRSELSRN